MRTRTLPVRLRVAGTLLAPPVAGRLHDLRPVLVVIACRALAAAAGVLTAVTLWSV